MRGLTFAICGLALLGPVFLGLGQPGLGLAAATAAPAAECPGNPDALGTSRTIVVDPTEHPRLGSMQYRESLPLRDHEVVLTFDDGPLPPRSTKILEILASECVKATYFMVGKMARSFPDMVRRIHAAGHTIGTHSFSHPFNFHKMSVEKAQLEINGGIDSVAWALGDGTRPAPFFRVPGLLRQDSVERYLASQHVQVWSADFPADDWTKITPTQVYERAMQRIEANHRGILLLHDIQPRTVEALPWILQDLKRKGYHIVHVVPATPELPKTVTAAADWLVRGSHIWPQTPVYAEIDSELPAPSPASFGYISPFDSHSVMHGPLRRQRTVMAHGQVPLPPTPPVSLWPHSLDEPQIPQSDARSVLPAPSPQTLGYPTDTPKAAPAPERKASSFELVPETSGMAIDISRALLEAGKTDDSPTGSVNRTPPPPLRGPFTAMPRGAFP
jgi:peptidoglycan-N-acetylglucosamine deacetylase